MYFVILGGIIAYSDSPEVCKAFGSECHYVEECQTENSSNCYWDAQCMGNGEGRSFLNYQGQVYLLE